MISMRLKSARRIVVFCIFTAALTMLLGCVGKIRAADPAAKKTLRVEEPPADWKFEPRFSGKPLVWETIETEMGEWQRCLLLRRASAKAGEEGEFTLQYIARRPNVARNPNLARNPNIPKPAWNLLTVHDSLSRDSKNDYGWRRSLKRYKTLPDDNDIADFLSHWSWERETRNWQAFDVHSNKMVLFQRRLTAGGICAGTWKELLHRDAHVSLFPELMFHKRPEKK